VDVRPHEERVGEVAGRDPDEGVLREVERVVLADAEGPDRRGEAVVPAHPVRSRRDPRPVGGDLVQRGVDHRGEHLLRELFGEARGVADLRGDFRGEVVDPWACSWSQLGSEGGTPIAVSPYSIPVFTTSAQDFPETPWSAEQAGPTPGTTVATSTTAFATEDLISSVMSAM